MKKMLLLTAVVLLTVGSAVGCRGGLGCLRNGDRCDHCDSYNHACNMSTPVVSDGPEVIVPRTAPTRRNLNVLPGPVDRVN